MPGSMPATSQLEWLSSTTAMIVLFWSRATRDLLRSFDWGIAALHRLDAATKLPCLAARHIASIGPARETDGRGEGDPWPIIVVSRDPCLNDPIQLIGPASLFGNGRDPVVRAGPMVRIQMGWTPSATAEPGSDRIGGQHCCSDERSP